MIRKYKTGDLVKIVAEMKDNLPELYGKIGCIIKVRPYDTLPYAVVFGNNIDDFIERGIDNHWGFAEDEIELV